MYQSLKRTTLLLCLATMAAALVPLQPAAAATVDFTVKGVISCSGGDTIAGMYMNSTGGGSGWITSRTRQPNRSGIEYYSYTVRGTSLPTTLRIDVGCGTTTKPNEWATSNRGPDLVVKTDSNRYVNMWCYGDDSLCKFAKRGTGGSTTTNPFTGCWCTALASARWKEAVGSYVGWEGNAVEWAERAKSSGWTVSDPATYPVARPRSLMSRPSPIDPAGHVGYVEDVRYVNGKTQILLYERNANDSCKKGNEPNSDTKTWRDVTSNMRFIVAPPAGA
ncbi:CHAP domain-containing protein [Nocardioides sp. MAHUQ-72]|uniref:CHAP domain-containing protein n=1 Tax=unclassified Nocardioides TaxID=2615069 RepID=UPI00361F6D69